MLNKLTCETLDNAPQCCLEVIALGGRQFDQMRFLLIICSIPRLIDETVWDTISWSSDQQSCRDSLVVTVEVSIHLIYFRLVEIIRESLSLGDIRDKLIYGGQICRFNPTLSRVREMIQG